MKLLLLISVVCFAQVALAAPADKQKREILPGDPRYGTDYHHHHHHHEHEHEHENEVPQTSYGPPSYKPGKPLSTDYLAPADATKSPSVIQVPSTSYGIPETTQLLNNNYLGPAIEEKKPEPIKAPFVDALVSSYANVKHEEHVQIPQTSYGIPVVKTPVQTPSFESVHVQKTVIPEVHHEVHHQHQQPALVHKHVETVPQVKVTTSHLSSAQPQGFVQHSSVPSFASYPSYSSYSSIPVKTVDHHVHVQVPQPYPVPVTKHVTYPVPVPHAVEVPKPYYVRVAQPVQVTVNRPYAVEVPRPVPYPVPHYVRTSVPVIQQQHHVNVETAKANPVQGFFENTQSTFQNVLDNLPSFQNPLQGFQNPFESFELPSLPSLPAFPSFVSQGTQTQVTAPVDVPAPVISDSVTVDNPTLKTETTSQPFISAHHFKTIQPSKDSVATVTASTIAKEYIQPTDVNGGYVY